MHLTATQSYTAPVERVAAMLADVEFVRWRAKWSSGEGDVEQAEVTGTSTTGFTVVVRRTLPTDSIPAQARALVGDRVEVRQIEAWEPPAGGELRATVTVEITGAPVRLTGTVALTPDGPRTNQVYDGEIRATVPLFGHVVEKATESALREALTTEQRAGQAWLDDQTS
ncbi:hypothetical protein GCM10025865_21210 [Paraoerskovia sediminicola]|uniref:DUF2505 domain-containing protein n=1 Tax=Paraoerskovia sediminicola TaxID=1138587 RepID=A0ABM8G408_9CELL|nr:DUF2505 domain-containing protein [Paraoerskovia sediminicola]BDZ42822.1 hypothetical protein GCM10025865_21210 [Paraoerskovia sediminicola]